MKKEEIIFDILRPETELEKRILVDNEYKEGLFWGTPRYGHPEGKVIFHIREVLDNVDKMSDITEKQRASLRLITLIHDTFKYKENESRKIFGRQPNNHHAVFAANFAEQYIKDEAILQVLLLHDEAYYAWRLKAFKREQEHQKKLKNLLNELGDNLQLFYLFFKCDTCTGDKDPRPLEWFETEIKGIQITEIA
ncbi:MAG: HD domain-containing protein [Saprospiraceae bacterium]